MRYLLLFLAVLSHILYSNTANAYTCTPAGTFNITIPSLYYPSTGVPNDKIGSVYTAPTQSIITCSDTSGITSQALKFRALGYTIGTVAAADGSQLFLANGAQNGIGYAIGATASCGTGGFVKPYTSYIMDLCSSTFTGNVTPQVQFYQTKYSSDITVSTINTTYAGDVLIYINGKVAYNVPVYFNSFSVVQPPCTVSTNSVSVKMDNIDKRLFTGVGSTAGGTNFNISLNCSKAAKLALQIDTAQASPSKNLGLIPINTGSGAATGIAIQLINNQTNSYFRIGSAVTLNNSTVGTYNISLKAGYFQTNDTVTAGTVNASATFTVTYP